MKTPLAVLKSIHIAMMAGLLVFIGVVVYLITTKSIDTAGFPPEFLYVSILIGGSALLVAPMVFKTVLNQNLKGKVLVQDKFMSFQTAHIVRLTLFEGAALFGVVASMLTGDLFGLIVPLLLLGTMWLNMPSKVMLREKLNLGEKELDQL